MEDQSGDSYVDTHKGIVVNRKNQDDGDDRYLSLPEWGPPDGYRLMESFTAGLRNPPVREKISAALNRGRGVFRAFKDALSPFPEVEKLWFAYKKREMKREVIHWYNALQESGGLDLIGEEPEDIENLVLEDFRFRTGCEADRELAEKLHRDCIDKTENAEELDEKIFSGDFCIVAESAGGEFAAYTTAAFSKSGSLHVRALEVKPEYRGLGLGKALLSQLLKQADTGNIPLVSIDLPENAENFSRVLFRENFQPIVTRYHRKR